MAKIGASIAGVAPLPAEGFLRETPVPLTLDERVALRAIFANPAFQKAYRNALCVSPGPMVSAGVLDTALGSVKANNRLHEMRGWEMFRAALSAQVLDPTIKPSKVPETYSEGLEIVKPPKSP